MAYVRKESIYAAIDKAFALTDDFIHDNLEKRYEFRRQTILADETIIKDEKSIAIRLLIKDFDYYKLVCNEGTKRVCKICQNECLATLYCEHCIRNYLKEKFSSWTSENNEIDSLIQKCQIETITPDRIIEWIPYNHLENIEYLTKGGCAKIYTAYWINGKYDEWNSKKNQLERSGKHKVILKRLENIETASRSWFEEVLIIVYI
jgi:hypothetical protein